MENNFFLGIDLGTTNSVISYLNIRDGRLIPTVLQVPRVSDTQGTTSAPTLPSVVYYKKDAYGNLAPYVGDFAKAQYGKRYGYVIKSVKSSMGSAEVPGISEELSAKRPEDISAEVLRQLVTGARKKLLLKEDPRDIIITIPASFDSDMREATLKAAQKAGIAAYNADGSPRDILLYEPKAVLYDFVNSQRNGEIPDALMDLSTPKNVLVYDLGGGTLDVSLHRVSQGEGEMLAIEDIAISRYSQIGGDNFDRLLARDLEERFLSQYEGLINLTEQVREEILMVFLKKAEQLKIEMNNAYDILAARGETLPEEYEVNLTEVNLYGGFAFDEYVTLGELQRDIAPLLADGLTLEMAHDIAAIAPESIENIIYPVLDTLAKAYAREPELKIDYVLLNGGMSKFFPVVRRLEKLFSCPILTFGDPDMSVAKGASIYHYLLHKYEVASHTQEAEARGEQPKMTLSLERKEKAPLRPGTILAEKTQEAATLVQGKPILNDTLGLELEGGQVKPLLLAGTELPAASEVLRDFRLRNAGGSIRLPLYYGSGATVAPPNRKIAERILTFDRVAKAGAEVSLQVVIDKLGLISIPAWLGEDEKAAGEVSLDTGGRKGILLRKERRSRPILPYRVSLAKVGHFKEQLDRFCEFMNKNIKSYKSIAGYHCDIKSYMKALTAIGSGGTDGGAVVNNALFAAANPELKGRLITIGAKFYAYWSEAERASFHLTCSQVLKEAVERSREGLPLCSPYLQTVNAMAFVGEEEDVRLLRELVALRDRTYSPTAAIVLGKLYADPTLIITCLEEMGPENLAQLQSYPWAIGKLCSRELNLYDNTWQMEKAVLKCASLISSNSLQNLHIMSMLVYALGELCDCREGVARPLSQRCVDFAREALTLARVRVGNRRRFQAAATVEKINLALRMMSGKRLTEAETAQLLALRSGE